MNPELQKLALEGIKLIEQHAKRWSHAHFKVGIEQEFFAYPQNREEENLFSQTTLENEFYPEVKNAPGFFIKREIAKHKYEYINAPLSPANSINDILKFRELSFKRAKKLGVETLSYDSFQNENNEAETAGLHINTSINIDDENHFFQNPKEARYAQLGTIKIMAENFYLIFPEKEESLARHEINLDTLHAVKTRESSDELRGCQDSRIENRIPGAEADPYIACFLSLAGAYLGYLEKEDIKKDIPITRTYGNPQKHEYGYKTPNNAPQALNNFKNGQLLENFLNTLSAEVAGNKVKKNFGTHFKNEALRIIENDEKWNALSTRANSYRDQTRSSQRF